MEITVNLSETEVKRLQSVHKRMLAMLDVANRRNFEAEEAVDYFFAEVDKALKRHQDSKPAAASS